MGKSLAFSVPPDLHTLQRGIEALNIVLANAILQPSERKLLTRILKQNLIVLRRLQESRLLPDLPATDTQPTADKKTAEKAANAAKRALQKRANMLEQKRQQQILETHKKSGFTTYLVRVGGSFEGSKKR
jgi:hypothetical protein